MITLKQYDIFQKELRSAVLNSRNAELRILMTDELFRELEPVMDKLKDDDGYYRYYYDGYGVDRINIDSNNSSHLIWWVYTRGGKIK